MPDPRVLNLPQAPLYRDGEQPQSAMGVFVVGDLTDAFSQTARLIDFTGGKVIGLAAGDAGWSNTSLEGYQPQVLVCNTTPILFAMGENPDPLNGPIILMPGSHPFQVLKPEGEEAAFFSFRNLEPAPEGYVTINWVLPTPPLIGYGPANFKSPRPTGGGFSLWIAL